MLGLVRGGSVLLAGLLAGLALIGCGGCSGSGQWVSHATFTIRDAAGSGDNVAGPYTATDSTVPGGTSGNAELQQSSGNPPGTVGFQVIIGDNPDEGTNLYQFTWYLPTYRGVGSYTLRSGENETTFDVTVGSGLTSFAGFTNIWSLERSSVAACAIEITADVAMRDPTVREARGRITCHGLDDGNSATSTSDLTGHFDVFAEIWCSALAPVRPCRTPPPE
jgi:hypothetical protein